MNKSLRSEYSNYFSLNPKLSSSSFRSNASNQSLQLTSVHALNEGAAHDVAHSMQTPHLFFAWLNQAIEINLLIETMIRWTNPDSDEKDPTDK